MNYNKDVLASVLRELENEKIRKDAECEERKARIYSLLPRVAEIDSELRSSAFDIIRASFGKADDSRALIEKTKSRSVALRTEREKLLSEANIPFDFAETSYSCEQCSDTGYTGGVLCPCVASRYALALAREVNKSLNVGAFDFSLFDINLYPEKGNPSPRAQMREVFDFCKNYAADFGKASESLYMSGNSGLGKTFLASCIAKAVAEKGFSVVFDSAFSILGKYEDVKFSRSDEDLGIFKTCDLLILDDIGSEMATPFSNAALLDLINCRMQKGKATIAISTLSSPELLRRYGAQTASRLEGSFIKLQFLGDDVRLMF